MDLTSQIKSSLSLVNDPFFNMTFGVVWFSLSCLAIGVFIFLIYKDVIRPDDCYAEDTVSMTWIILFASILCSGLYLVFCTFTHDTRTTDNHYVSNPEITRKRSASLLECLTCEHTLLGDNLKDIMIDVKDGSHPENTTHEVKMEIQSADCHDGECFVFLKYDGKIYRANIVDIRENIVLVPGNNSLAREYENSTSIRSGK